MREILFRGKRVDNGEWVEGSLVCWQTNDNTDTIIRFEDPDEAGLALGEHIEVYRDTVGQFTGVTDRSGKKIFEGDIVKGPMVYDCGQYPQEVTVTRPITFNLAQFDGVRSFNGAVEIIGNIHDNPELLEVKKG